MHTEKVILNKKRNVKLTAYLLEVSGEFSNITKRPAVIVLPGGGYQFCSDREADPVAMAYLKAGYHVFILRYSVKNDSKWPNPLEDYETAMELIRSKEEEWNVLPDRIAVIGFSAGGHLAACAATMSKYRPSAAILGYAVVNEDVKMCNSSAPNVIPEVDSRTCPCFIFSSRTDNVVPISNAIQFMNALVENQISFESHIYAFGPHGFSTCDSSVQILNETICKRMPNWVQDSISWLHDMMGDFGKEGLTEPVCKPQISDDGKAFLSVDCSIGHLYANPMSRELIESIIAGMQHLNTLSETNSLQDVEGLKQAMLRMNLRDLLSFGGVPAAEVLQFNEQLSKIPNI